MNKFAYKRNGKKRVKSFALFLTFIIVIVGIIFVVYKLFFIPPPVIEGIESFNLLPVEKTITLKGKNLKSINIFIIQNNRQIELLKDMPENPEKTYVLLIKPKDLGLMDGSAKVFVNATSGILKKVEYKINSTIDTIPPKLEIIKASPVIYRGSAGAASLRAKDADSVFIKLIVPTLRDRSRGDYTFSAFKTSSGGDPKSVSTYFVFFPAPFNFKDDGIFYAVAEDAAGNQNVRALRTKLKDKKYKESSINIDDFFINTVVSSLLNKTDISDPVSAFKEVNEVWRENIAGGLIEIARESESRILWRGRFLQLKNSKVMATYGDSRTYFYKGNPISKSVHLGYDLASFTNAPVKAANSGIVRFAGDLGIYGSTVIIDHGLGLMSLYGHLSMIVVSEDQKIEKGEIIGATGSTGLAGGDHLHFGILIHGYEVSPLYWWDKHWIEVSILEYLEKE